MKDMKLGFFIDGIVAKVGLRFLCFKAFPSPPEDFEHMKSDKPEIHNPDIFGGLRCAYCNRLKGFHLASNLSKNVL